VVLEKKNNPYLINFVSLSRGLHHFKYNIDKSFFDLFEYSPIEKGDLNLELDFDKKEDFFQLNFIFDGYVQTICDRCSDELNITIDKSFELIVKFADTERKEEDDIVFISRDETQIDLSSFIYEYINLSLPLKKAHENIADCNKESIKKLSELKATAKADIDPRWEQLKALKKD